MRRRPRPVSEKPHPPEGEPLRPSQWRASVGRLARRLHSIPAALAATALLVLLCVLGAAVRVRLHGERSRPRGRVCAGRVEAVSAVRGEPGRATVSVGGCEFQFIRGASCALGGSPAHEALPVLPCANATLPLSAADSGRVLRAFGFRSRSSAALPAAVHGALIPLRAAAAPALRAPDVRPAAWQPLLPHPRECTPGNCRLHVRAMLASYVAGCGPLAAASLWMLRDITGPKDRGGPPLLAFPRGCGRMAQPDPVAEALLIAYLRRACEAPAVLWPIVRALRRAGGAHRAEFLTQVLGHRGRFWGRSGSPDSICDGALELYEYDAWTEDAAAMAQVFEMDEMVIEK